MLVRPRNAAYMHVGQVCTQPGCAPHRKVNTIPKSLENCLTHSCAYNCGSACAVTASDASQRRADIQVMTTRRSPRTERLSRPRNREAAAIYGRCFRDFENLSDFWTPPFATTASLPRPAPIAPFLGVASNRHTCRLWDQSHVP
jgi:hypothetical protein